MTQSIYLYMQRPDHSEFITLARLTVEHGVGQLQYAPSYINDYGLAAWVPDDIHYPLRTQPYTIHHNHGIPSFVMDIMPDAWGQTILKRVYARQKNTPWTELDFLIKAQNADRFGNLCVGETKKITQKSKLESFQPFVKLAEFLDFSDALRNGEAITRVKLALAQTTSLGGARPKITLFDDQKLYLAKPKDRDDLINIPNVEFACLSFAQQKGLNVAQHQLLKVKQHGVDTDVLVLERFDRIFSDQLQQFMRVPMISGLTLLDASWKSIDQARWSYPLMANEMIRKGMQQQEVHELYRRMIFNALIGNDDDHPKNHAFMYQNGKWQLAPLFDIVPNQAYKPQGLSMRIGKFGQKISRENILSMAAQFLLTESQALAILQEILSWESELIQHYQRLLTAHDAEIVIHAMGIDYLS